MQGVSQEGPSSSMAIVSLVAGILGFTFLPFIGSIVAVITGIMARREIEASRGALGGQGLATAGLVLGWVGVGLSVLGLCVFGAMFALPFCLALFGLASDYGSTLIPLLIIAA